MNVFDMKQLGTELGLTERLFVTRENGERVYPYLAQAFKNISDKQVLILVFPENQLIDASFADECIVQIGRQLLNGEFGHRGFLLQGLTANSVKNISSVIAFHGLQLGFLAVEPTDEWQCVGQIGESLLEVLNIIGQRRQITAPELAEVLKIEVNTVNNRLKRLHNCRLIWREHEVSEKGLQYIYHFWDWTSNSSTS